MKRIVIACFTAAGTLAWTGAGLRLGTSAAAQRRSAQAAPPTLGLEQGAIDLETPELRLKLVAGSQTVAALEPKSAPGFDFTPADQLSRRASNGYHHLGDLIVRVKRRGASAFEEYDTARDRKAVTALPGQLGAISADLGPTLPADCPLRIARTWQVRDGHLALRFTLTNSSKEPVEIDGLGIPVVFNNMLTGRSLKEAHQRCSFFDPYIGEDAGYLQVTRLSGQGPALVVVPEGDTPFEAYMPLNEPTRPNQTFEGAFAWMVHTKAYVANEWKSAEPWNAPTSSTLSPGAARSYGLRFLLSPTIRGIEKTLLAAGRPVAVGIPGYILPQDLDGRLFLKYGKGIASWAVQPAGAMTVKRLAVTPGGWQPLSVKAVGWGRARLTITYADGLRQTVSYYLTKPAAQAVADLGRFLTTKQWFEQPDDPFHRSPSVISYDREADRQVTQDSRVWIAGLGDEGGSGSWLAAAMKEFGQPDARELAKYEQFADRVLWGGLQYRDGPNKFGVRKSLFFYEPAAAPGVAYDTSRNWGSWTSWNKRASEDIGRGYDYPHVVAAYWALYHVARNQPGILRLHTWDWYLNQAYETTRFAFSRYPNGRRRVGYVELGLMDGDAFLALLGDLKREGWKEKAAEIEALMKERADRWSREEFPFGSEMAWDSTGQEEVYAWCRYFGYDDKALVSLNSILGYMPTLPHWGYNGNARRYWDFLYGGKLTRIERQVHHYGSGLNAIPVLAEYRRHPDDFYLLRVGYGGMMGALSNIDRDGFASVAFHSYPQALKWDGYSGDYGPNFFGHAYNTGTYVIKHPDFGWQAFGGNVETVAGRVRIRALDSLRRRVFIAPIALWLTLDAGRFDAVEINPKTGTVKLTFAPDGPFEKEARLRIEQPATGHAYAPAAHPKQERGAYVIPLGAKPVWIELRRG